jgi:hypothetical protein
MPRNEEGKWEVRAKQKEILDLYAAVLQYSAFV